jgi:hypothetical protein
MYDLNIFRCQCTFQKLTNTCNVLFRKERENDAHMRLSFSFLEGREHPGRRPLIFRRKAPRQIISPDHGRFWQKEEGCEVIEQSKQIVWRVVFIPDQASQSQLSDRGTEREAQPCPDLDGTFREFEKTLI